MGVSLQGRWCALGGYWRVARRVCWRGVAGDVGRVRAPEHKQYKQRGAEVGLMRQIGSGEVGGSEKNQSEGNPRRKGTVIKGRSIPNTYGVLRTPILLGVFKSWERYLPVLVSRSPNP